MKTIILKTFILLAMTFSLVLVALVLKSDQYIDKYYPKFTKKYSSLIVGSSRAFYGLSPEYLGENFLNFSFSMLTSPYGEIYNNSIFNKIKDSRENIFILEVNPYALARNLKNNSLREIGGVLDEIYDVTSSPNLEYIFRFYEKPLERILSKNKKKPKFYDSGWMYEKKYDFFQEEKLDGCLTRYEKNFNSSRYSNEREKALVDLIRNLKSFGKVILTRLYIHNDFYKLENKYFPEFNQKMQLIANKYDLNYINFNVGYAMGKSLLRDCHHLNRKGARKSSLLLFEML